MNPEEFIGDDDDDVSILWGLFESKAPPQRTSPVAWIALGVVIAILLKRRR